MTNAQDVNALVDEARARADSIRSVTQFGNYAYASSGDAAMLDRLAAALTSATEREKAAYARGREEARVFVEFALRHTLPARAKERTHEETYSILAFHPFAQALKEDAQ